MVNVKVSTTVGETEDPERVKLAVKNFFHSAELVGRSVTAIPEQEELEELRNKIAAKGIGATILDQLIKNKVGGKTSIMLHKQAAFAGKLAVVDNPKESPGGPIVVEIEWDDEFVQWISGSRLPEKNHR